MWHDVKLVTARIQREQTGSFEVLFHNCQHFGNLALLKCAMLGDNNFKCDEKHICRNVGYKGSATVKTTMNRLDKATCEPSSL